MKRMILLLSIVLLGGPDPGRTQEFCHTGDIKNYRLYPEVNQRKPDILSPFVTFEGPEYVVAVTKEKKYAIIPVTLSNERGICRQLVVDSLDFPALARDGLHDRNELSRTRTITGRSVEEITRLAQPGQLSTAGFLAAGEDILSVLIGDNRTVKKLQLTHPQLARPLFHVLNMMDEDLALERRNMARHAWENIVSFYYYGKQVSVEAFDTRGRQLSIFDDGIEGAFHIRLRREPDQNEQHYLQDKYGHLPPEKFSELLSLLCEINTGEMQPQYIQRYGFYEGHTFWRADLTLLVAKKIRPEEQRS